MASRHQWESIKLAHHVLGSEVALLVMIRPKNENFCFEQTELENMQQSIANAAQYGATGVVIGALDTTQTCFDLDAMQVLVDKAKEHHLSITCHRAFDLLANPIEGLKQLKCMGCASSVNCRCRLGQEQSGRTTNTAVYTLFATGSG